MRNGSLWSSIDFEMEVISHLNNKRLLARSLLFLYESTQIRPTRVFFLSSFSHNSDDQLGSNVHRFVILSICWITPSENTGLWQLPIVNVPFKPGSYFLQMWMRYKFWRHKFAMNNSPQLNCAQLLQNNRCKNSPVNSWWQQTPELYCAALRRV